MITKMRTVINDYGLQYSKAINNVVEEKKGGGLTDIVVCRDCLGPLREEVSGDDDTSIPHNRVRVPCHKINTPFSEWSARDDRMEMSRRCSHISIVNMAGMEFPDR